MMGRPTITGSPAPVPVVQIPDAVRALEYIDYGKGALIQAIIACRSSDLDEDLAAFEHLLEAKAAQIRSIRDQLAEVRA